MSTRQLIEYSPAFPGLLSDPR